MNCTIVMRVEQGSEKSPPNPPINPAWGVGEAEHSDWEILHIFDDLACFKVMLKSCVCRTGGLGMGSRETGMTLTHDVAGSFLHL